MANATNVPAKAIIFAARIGQEFMSMVAKATETHKFSCIFLNKACGVGDFGFYAEFTSAEQKDNFLNDIHEKNVYFAEVWAA